MKTSTAALDELIRLLNKFPGIGRKSAERMAFYLLSGPATLSENLIQAVQRLRREIRWCEQCYQVTTAHRCTICSDTSRLTTCLCVVEKPSDVAAIEATEVYRGLYHVLHGGFDASQGVIPQQLDSLMQRLQHEKIDEVVLALNATVIGDSTLHYLITELRPICELRKIRISRLHEGLPVGAHLQHCDHHSLAQALEQRQQLP